jgi:hypothetical protein
MNNYRHMAFAWGLLLLIVAAFAAGMWIPLWVQTEQNQARILALQDRIAKFHALKLTQTELNDALIALQQSDGRDDAGQFIVAKSPILGTAELQRRINGIIGATGARQISSQALSKTDTADFYKLKVTVNLSGSLQAIQRILFALEHDQPRLFIEHARIQGKRTGRRRLSAAQQRQRLRILGAQPHTDLSAQLLVTAYMQRGEETDAIVANR